MTLEQLQAECTLLLRALDYGIISQEFHDIKIDKLFANQF